MLRTLFAIGVMALLGLLALKLVFGILPFVLGLFLGLLFLAGKILLVGLVAYFVISLVAPGTARRLRERFSGTPSTF